MGHIGALGKQIAKEISMGYGKRDSLGIGMMGGAPRTGGMMPKRMMGGAPRMGGMPPMDPEVTGGQMYGPPPGTGRVPPALRHYQREQGRVNDQIYKRSPNDFAGPQYAPAYNQTPYEPFNQQLQNVYQNQRALPGSAGQSMTVPMAPEPDPAQGGDLPVGPDGRINWKGVNFGGIDWSRVDWGKFLGNKTPY